MKYKTLFTFICIFIVSISVCVFCIQTAQHKEYVVPGIVVSKDTEQYAHGKHYRNMSTRYIMCVKPNDTNKFKNYDLYVDYTTYCTHNVGDKITFSLSEKKCLRDFKSSIWIEHISGIVFILFAVLSVFLETTVPGTLYLLYFELFTQKPQTIIETIKTQISFRNVLFLIFFYIL